MIKRLALVGQNISYSLSPLVHRAIFDCLKLDASYELCDLKPHELDLSNERLKSFDGFNVTQPYKLDITKLLTKNNSPFDAVNAVVNLGGLLYGYNTDALGFDAVLRSRFDGLKGLTALVYGAGGMGTVAVKVLKDLGASVYIYNRTRQKAEDLASKFKAKVADENVELCPNLMVNCISRGLYDDSSFDFLRLDYSLLEYAFDSIYFDTAFLRGAKGLNKNCVTENGLKMLIWQAVFADELFLQIKIENKTELVDNIFSQISGGLKR